MALSKKKITLIALSLILIFLVSVFNFKEKPNMKTQSVERTVKLVEVETVNRAKAQRLSELSAALEASEEIVLSFEVTGRLLELTYKEGDRISAGTLVARISATEYSLQVSQADAGVSKAEVSYQQVQRDFERIEQLYQEGVVSLSDYEKASERLQVAEKELLQARETANLLEQDKTRLVTPVSGTILAKHAAQGQIISSGSPVYTIGRLDPLKTVLPVPDKDITGWRKGDKVTLALYGQKRQGEVTRVYPSTNKDTGTVGVEVTVSNPKCDWLPGQVVLANRTQVREGLYVPVSAVINRGEKKPYVFLAVDGKAVKKPVTTGELFGDNIEINSGLQPGDRIVVKGADQLFDGDAIEEPGGSNQ